MSSIYMPTIWGFVLVNLFFLEFPCSIYKFRITISDLPGVFFSVCLFACLLLLFCLFVRFVVLFPFLFSPLNFSVPIIHPE